MRTCAAKNAIDVLPFFAAEDIMLCVYFNPLRSNSDRRQISLCNIKAVSVREVVIIKDMMCGNKKGEFAV